MLLERKAELTEAFTIARPFGWVKISNFLHDSALHQIQNEFPKVTSDWINASGLNTKRKWTQPAVAGSVAAQFYEDVNSPEFLELLSAITGIPRLLPDPDLFGAGYHQTFDGGYLNVHIDFNYHNKLHLDRRLNLIVYLNREWAPTWGGALELWDTTNKKMIAEVPPTENTAVLFATNDISYHGHPKPWNSGGRSARQSLSTYYYSNGRDDGADARPHSTRYVNTEGATGLFKAISNGVTDVLRGGPIRRRLNLKGRR